MVQLTPEQKSELKEIMNNQYASGPFSGMVFNQVAQILTKNTDNLPAQEIIDAVVQVALQTKLRLKELSQ